MPCHREPPTAWDVLSAKKSARPRSAYPHGERAAEVIEDDPRARISRVVHCERCGGDERSRMQTRTGAAGAMGMGVDGCGRVLGVSDALNFSRANPGRRRRPSPIRTAHVMPGHAGPTSTSVSHVDLSSRYPNLPLQHVNTGQTHVPCTCMQLACSRIHHFASTARRTLMRGRCSPSRPACQGSSQPCSLLYTVQHYKTRN
jgi:hypothetical protein